MKIFCLLVRSCHIRMHIPTLLSGDSRIRGQNRRVFAEIVLTRLNISCFQRFKGRNWPWNGANRPRFAGLFRGLLGNRRRRRATQGECGANATESGVA